MARETGKAAGAGSGSGAGDRSGAGEHPIGVVAERTGLSAEVLRVWERRYGAVRPDRDAAGQRLYTDADVERLQLLRRATQGGRAIGSVASLPGEELQRLVREDDRARARVAGADPAPARAVVDVEEAIGLVRDLDAQALELTLTRAATVLGAPHFVESVVAPFMRRIGDEWHAGRLSPAHEHLATAAVQRVLARLLGTLADAGGAPAFVVATLAGERHEVGALLAAAVAAAVGWRVVYLGADLPARDIATAAILTNARAVGLSVVYAADPAPLAEEVRAIRRLLPASVPLVAGGAGAAAVQAAAGDLDVLWLGELEALRATLGRWHAQASR
jgi:MerR family transcriptional regulator, light-induced transcriptional regulator